LTPKAKAESVLVGTTLIWGGTFVIVKVGMLDISPILLTAIRFLVASTFYLVFFARRIFPLRWSSVTKGSILGFFLFLGFVSQNIGLTITTASKSAFITSMMVVFVPILQFIIEKRSPKLGNILGIISVVAGLWLLTSPAGSAFNIGDAMTLICAVVFAMYIVYLDVISNDMTPLQLTFLQMASTAVFSLAATFLFEEAAFRFSGSSIFSLLYLTVLATILTTYVQTRFQKDTTPTRAAIIFTIEPVFASVSAYFVLHESMGNLGILGAALILTGVSVSQLSDAIPWLNKSFENNNQGPG
jgi:drug/metabolite transporter (DMT)-like permease